MDKSYLPGYSGEDEDDSNMLNFRGIVYCK